MAISLAQLCRNAEKSYEMKLIAGRGGLDNTVRWVHMVEDSDVPSFLHGNELVFTTGIGHTGSDWLIPFVKSLKEHRAAGLVINLGQYIESVPARLIVFCEDNDFPLFTLPWQVKIIDITYNFCRRIIDNEEAETSFAEAFRNLIFTPERRDTYAAMLERSGFRENASYTVISVAAVSGKSTSGLLKSNDYALWRLFKRSRTPCALFFQEDRLTVIRQSVSAEEIKRLINDISSAEFGSMLNIGVSDTGESLAAVPVCYKQAVSALKAAQIKGTGCFYYRNIGVYKLLFGVENISILSDFAETVLGSVIRYDSMNGTDFENTLKRYLECSGSVQLTAEKLGVHRNTVNYKMKIIREIMNVEMNEEERMNILLALRAREILNSK